MQLTVTDVVFTGVYDLDTKVVYVPIDTLGELLYPQQSRPASMVEIKIDKSVSPESIIREIHPVFEEFAADSLGGVIILSLKLKLKQPGQTQER